MLRHVLIISALAALLVSVGVVTGISVLRSEDDGARAAAPELLTANPEPTLRPADAKSVLLGEDLSPRVLQRLAALEQALKQLQSDISKMSERLEPAVQIIDLINKKRQRSGRPGTAANETAAIATSRNVVSAQAQMQATGRIDTDGDGVGEYGGFLELSGALPGRMAKALNPPVLSRAFQVLTKSGEVTRSGYVYRIYLPDGRGNGISEPEAGFASGDVDSNLSETTWCMYAWPVEYGKTGTRTYFINQAGDTLETDDDRYSGSGNGPAADAAFRSGHAITGQAAVRQRGQDGNTWKQAN